MKTARAILVASILAGAGTMIGLAPSNLPAPAAHSPYGAAGVYAVDPIHTTLVFKISHNAGTFFGRFDKISGDFLLDPADLKASSLGFTIDTTSIDTANEKRDQDLKGDFFNVKQFPKSTFKSTSIKKTGEGSFEAAGDLTLCGMTKPVTIKITSARTGTNPMNKKENAGFEGAFSIKRSDFGITKYPGMLGEEVTIMVGVEGNR